VALRSNGPTMSPRPLLLWATDKSADYDRIYKKKATSMSTLEFLEYLWKSPQCIVL
jgi:hypothetical protein